MLIALGSNRPGRWGSPRQAVLRAMRALDDAGVQVRTVSGLYETAPMGSGRQDAYVNAAVAVDTALPPGALLMRLKRLEHLSGRRGGRRWGPRTLDLDLLDYKGCVRHWRGSRPRTGGGRSGLVLPHPGLHQRPFVLRPLMELAPRWRHPVLRRTAAELWRAVRSSPGRVLKRLD